MTGIRVQSPNHIRNPVPRKKKFTDLICYDINPYQYRGMGDGNIKNLKKNSEVQTDSAPLDKSNFT